MATTRNRSKYQCYNKQYRHIMASPASGACCCSTVLWGSRLKCSLSIHCQACLLLVLAGLFLQTAAQEKYVGQFQEIVVHSKKHYQEHAHSNDTADHDHVHLQQHYLRLKTGEMRQLSFPKLPKHLPRTGTSIMVQTRPQQDCGIPVGTSGILCVGKMMAREAAPRDVFSTGQPRGQMQIKALVMQLQVCGQGPATSPDKLAGALFDSLPNSQAETLQGMFRACSNMQADFSQQVGGVVVPVAIPIPCTGKTPWGAPFDSSTCPYTEWSDVANQHVKDVLGYNWEDFKYKIYVVPPGDLCSWGGMGWVGCQQDCRAWISGDLWQYPTTWLHELGHNMYLNHAGSMQYTSGMPQFVDYKDDTGAMGHCCSTRCFNGPHSFQLGWSKLLGVLHKDNLAAGEWHSFTLPPRVGDNSRDVSLLRVFGDWTTSAAHNLFLEYRKAQSYDVGLYEGVKDKVTMYSTPVGDAMPYTTFEAAIAENQILRETRTGSNLVVWVGGATPDGIRVHLCRPQTAKEESCDNGKDDDCDGFTDSEDPDCRSRGIATVRKMLAVQRPSKIEPRPK